MLNTKRNKFNFFEIAQPTSSFCVILLFVLSTCALMPQSNRFTAGPATLMRMLCIAVAFAEKETYAGARKRMGECNNFKTIPINKPVGQMENVASKPNASATNLCPNSCRITAGAATIAANLTSSQSNHGLSSYNGFGRWIKLEKI